MAVSGDKGAILAAPLCSFVALAGGFFPGRRLGQEILEEGRQFFQQQVAAAAEPAHDQAGPGRQGGGQQLPGGGQVVEAPQVFLQAGQGLGVGGAVAAGGSEKFDGVTQLLEGDAQAVAAGVVQLRQVAGQTAGLAGAAVEAPGGEIGQGALAGRLFPEGEEVGTEFQQQAGVGRRAQQAAHSEVGGLGATVGVPFQAGQLGSAGECGVQGRQGFAEEHVPVAGFSQAPAQVAPGAGPALPEGFRQHRGEQLEQGTQAADGDPHLVHVFRAVAALGAGLVGLQVLQAVQGGAAAGGQGRQVRVQGRRTGFLGRAAAAGEQGVAPLRLARRHRVQGLAFAKGGGQFPGQGEEGGLGAGQELQFQFPQGLPLTLALDGAPVQGDLDAGAGCRFDNPGEAGEVGGEGGFQAGRALFQPVPQVPIVHVGKIELAGCHLGFPLVAPGQAAAGRVGGLHRQQPVPALAPVAQGHALAEQFQVGGVVIGVEQPLALGGAAGQERMPQEAGGAAGGQAQLEFGFEGHGGDSTPGDLSQYDSGPFAAGPAAENAIFPLLPLMEGGIVG